MDPDACLSDIFDLTVEGDYGAAGDKARELLEWMERGGFASGGGRLRVASLTGFLEDIVRQGEEDNLQIGESEDDYVFDRAITDVVVWSQEVFSHGLPVSIRRGEEHSRAND